MGALLFILLIYIAWTNHRTMKLLKKEKGIFATAFGKFLEAYKEAHRKPEKEKAEGTD
jgi:hypothetical protein